MLKKTVKYTNFDDEVVSDIFYFNLTRAEVIEMEVAYGEGGLKGAINRIIDAKDAKNLIAEFKKLVLHCYGVKSEDGKRFIKSDELRAEFAQTAAYDELFMELATDDKAAADFIKGVLPKGLLEEMENEEKKNTPQDKPVGPPPPPRA